MNAKFSGVLRARRIAGFVPVIPDIKCTSPGEGDLLRGRDPVEAAALLRDAGAPALSVVTEPVNFGGSLALLERIVRATGLPVLRKDFIENPDDVRRTRDAGADAMLLMCATLTEDALTELYEVALACGLEPLVEAHTPEELRFAGRLGTKLIGINNRDILRLEKDGGGVATTTALAYAAPSGALLVSESGLLGPDDVRAAISAGAHAVLVGTAIWRAADMRDFYESLCQL